MKSLVELTKINDEELPQIYCDMDKVIVDLLGGYKKLTGKNVDTVEKEKRWEEIRAKKEFWPTLPWMSGAD